MAPKERTEIVENLERSRQEFIAAVAGLSESQAKRASRSGALVRAGLRGARHHR